MNKNFFIILSFLFLSKTIAQNVNTLWEGHFSYLNITVIAQGNGKIYASAENAVFVYDPVTFEIETISTIEGLSGETITTLHYSEIHSLILIGYENGLMDVYIEDQEEVLSVVDIFEKVTITPDRKRINHFNEYNGIVYVSTDFGISLYDLTRLEFGDTYYIGNGGSQISIRQTAVYNDYIYAACFDNSGIRRALVSNDNLIDYQEWTQQYSGNFEAVETVGSKLYAVGSNRDIFDISNEGGLSTLFNFPNPVRDVKNAESSLIVTTSNRIYVYDESFSPLLNLDSQGLNTEFSSGLLQDGFIYIGSTDFGVLSTDLLTVSEYLEIHPDGPLRNDPFAIQAGFEELWVTYGAHTFAYNPYPLNSRGISRYYDGSWKNIAFDSLLNARELNDIAINPSNPNQVFIGSFIDGILELNDGDITMLHNETNSGLESLILPNNPNYVDIRVSGLVFDNQGVLWSR